MCATAIVDDVLYRRALGIADPKGSFFCEAMGAFVRARAARRIKDLSNTVPVDEPLRRDGLPA